MIRNSLTFPAGSFLATISDESWSSLIQQWTPKKYKAGQSLITADSESKDVYFIMEGAAKATVYAASGRETSFMNLSFGDIFGEFSAIDDAPRSATVVAATACTAANLSALQFREILKNNPDISFTLLTIMVANLRGLSKRVVDFNSKSSNQRLREALITIAEKYARGADKVKIFRPPTQNELAAYIFASREGVAREMGRLKNQGLIDREKRNLIIPSLTALRESLSEYEI